MRKSQYNNIPGLSLVQESKKPNATPDFIQCRRHLESGCSKLSELITQVTGSAHSRDLSEQTIQKLDCPKQLKARLMNIRANVCELRRAKACVEAVAAEIAKGVDTPGEFILTGADVVIYKTMNVCSGFLTEALVDTTFRLGGRICVLQVLTQAEMARLKPPEQDSVRVFESEEALAGIPG